MKTIDELIKKFEICNELENLCSECPYIEERCSCDPDALHYLKTYQANKHAYEEGNRKAEEARERYMEAVRNCEVAENKYKRLCKGTSQNSAVTSQNDPLTWQELKQMEGKPVWVEADYFEKGWFLVDASLVNIWVTGYDCAEHQLRKEDIGVSWQAYRKERS